LAAAFSSNSLAVRLNLDSPNLGEALAIETIELTRRFGSYVAVDRLSLSVGRGIVFGLLGANGAGKSTTIKMLTTLLPPTSGKATVAGFDVVATSRAVRSRIGYVPQMLSADGGLTGRENLRLSAALYGMDTAVARSRIAEALAFMGLDAVGDKLVKTYSGGMIRRLELAQAMLHQPAVLFLDEPTIGLDPTARRSVWDRLLELRDRTGMTILLTTHDMEEADALCGELAILHQGVIAVSGKPSELKAALGAKATLDDVFAHHSGGTIQEGGRYIDVRQARNTARRLG
jgi:ABC-2 type transport system ATP-binding protein